MKGKWRIVEMADYESDYPDMMEPAYILFGAGDAGAKAVEFRWDGNDEMDEARGDGWAELQPDGSITGQICFHRGDEAEFIARPWTTSSTAC